MLGSVWLGSSLAEWDLGILVDKEAEDESAVHRCSNEGKSDPGSDPLHLQRHY